MRRRAFLTALLVGGGTVLSSFAMAASAASAQAAPGATTTLIFVRHAEAGAGDPRNPSLTPAGEARAQTLLKTLEKAGITAVYTSEYNRTQQTGGAVAKALNITPVTVPVNARPAGASMPGPDAITEGAKAMIARITTEQAGRTTLIVGHSNTVPIMVGIAAGQTIDPIADTEFDRLFIVTIRDGVASIVKARY